MDGDNPATNTDAVVVARHRRTRIDDAAEQEAGSAVDALDQWAYDEGCEGAAEPEEGE